MAQHFGRMLGSCLELRCIFFMVHSSRGPGAAAPSGGSLPAGPGALPKRMTPQAQAPDPNPAYAYLAAALPVPLRIKQA